MFVVALVGVMVVVGQLIPPTLFPGPCDDNEEEEEGPVLPPPPPPGSAHLSEEEAVFSRSRRDEVCLGLEVGLSA